MRVVFVPPVPALLPEYSQRQDPVRELRTACTEAVEWLLAGGARQVVVLHDPLEPEESARGMQDALGLRVARGLVGDRAGCVTGPLADGDLGEALMVMVNGTGRRADDAPGGFDPGAEDYDQVLDEALREGDPFAAARTDARLGNQLLAAGIPGLYELTWRSVQEARVDYADAPYGVQYWVARWLCD